MKKDACCDLIEMLCNKTRFSIIKSLRNKEKNVSELSRELKVNQTTISHNLAKMQECDVIIAEQKKKFRYYRIKSEYVIPILELAEKHARKYCHEHRRWTT